MSGVPRQLRNLRLHHGLSNLLSQVDPAGVRWREEFRRGSGAVVVGGGSSSELRSQWSWRMELKKGVKTKGSVMRGEVSKWVHQNLEKLLPRIVCFDVQD